MKKLLLFTLFLLINLQLFGQTFSPYGYIFSDTDKQPLQGVTVFVGEGKHNTVTDEKGYFMLETIPSSIKEIKCILIGHQDLIINVTDAEIIPNQGKHFMFETQTEIAEVVITAQAPMAIQHGDTTQFNAAAFKTNPDADADDLLAKMPGVVIQDGKVEAQGEEIKKIYVDGRLFFGTDPMEALKSIPADAIESIQLFDDLSDEEKETGISDSEPTKAINIVTKSKRDKNTILKLEALAGFDTQDPYDFRYLGGGNVSFFGKENRLTITGIANNVNTNSFGANSDPTEEKIDKNGNVMGQTQGVKEIQGVGVNFSREVKDKYKLSTSYFFNNVENTVEKTSVKDYFAVEDSYDERYVTTNSMNVSNSMMHKFNLKFEWKVLDNVTLTVSPEVKYQSYDYTTLSDVGIKQDADSVSYTENKYVHESSSLYLGGSALLAYRFEKKGRGLSLSASYNVNQSEFQRVQQQTSRKTFSSTTQLWTEKTGSDLTNKLIAQESETSNLKLKLSYAEPIIENHKVMISALANQTVADTYKSNDDWSDVDEDYTDANSDQYSVFNKIYNSYGASASYLYKTKGISLSTGVNVLSVDQQYIQEQPYDAETPMVTMDYQPFLTLRYRIPKKFYFRIYYKGYAVLPDASQMQNVVNDSNTAYLRIGNPDLETGYRHTLYFYMNRSNTEKSTNFNMSLYANTASNYITTSTEEMSEGDKITDTYTALEDGLVAKNINMDGYFFGKSTFNFSFTAKPLKSNVNFSLTYAYVRTPSVYYDVNYSNIHTTGFRVGLASNISENIDFNVYSSTAYSSTINTVLSNSSYFNQTLYLSSNFIVWRYYTINSEVTWRYYQNQGNYTVWNLGIGRKFFKQRNGEVRIVAYDLLNQNQNIQRYIRTSCVEAVNSNALGRYVVLRLSYRFNTMSMTPQPKKLKTKNSRDISVDELKEKSQKSSESGDKK
ncbi:MAG: outer membrane beta-barrel protein [Rikenellaceae bacterium]